MLTWAAGYLPESPPRTFSPGFFFPVHQPLDDEAVGTKTLDNTLSLAKSVAVFTSKLQIRFYVLLENLDVSNPSLLLSSFTSPSSTWHDGRTWILHGSVLTCHSFPWHVQTCSLLYPVHCRLFCWNFSGINSFRNLSLVTPVILLRLSISVISIFRSSFFVDPTFRAEFPVLLFERQNMLTVYPALTQAFIQWETADGRGYVPSMWSSSLWRRRYML